MFSQKFSDERSRKAGVSPVPSSSVLFLGLIVFIAGLQSMNAAASWLDWALKFQDELGQDYELPLVTRAQTHNSFNAPPTYQFPNQEIGLLAQLDLGVRVVELDIHYISQLSPSVRVCHGTADLRTACAQSWSTCNLFGIYDYGDSTGCTSTAKTLNQTLLELSGWVSNHTELIVIYIEDDGELPAAEIGASFNQYFGSSLFTPANKQSTTPNSWPSLNQLLNVLDKRVIVLEGTDDYGGVNFVEDATKYQWPGYPAKQVKHFVPYPSCSSNYPGAPPREEPESRYFGRFYGDEIVVGTLYNGPELHGVVTPAIGESLTACGYGATFDKINTDKLKAVVWSFAEDRPRTEATLNCAIQNSAGRWTDTNCCAQYRFACKSDTNSSQWVISTETGAWINATCPSGYSFAVPQIAWENQMLKLAKQAAGVSTVWLNLQDIVEEGKWAMGTNGVTEIVCGVDPSSTDPALNTIDEEDTHSGTFTNYSGYLALLIGAATLFL